MGNLRDTTLEEVWHSELAEKVRGAKYPACYHIRNADGVSLRDDLRPEYIHIAPLQETMRESLRRR